LLAGVIDLQSNKLQWQKKKILKLKMFYNASSRLGKINLVIKHSPFDESAHRILDAGHHMLTR
jgi:hypothetical protein